MKTNKTKITYLLILLTSVLVGADDRIKTEEIPATNAEIIDFMKGADSFEKYKDQCWLLIIKPYNALEYCPSNTVIRVSTQPIISKHEGAWVITFKE